MLTALKSPHADLSIQLPFSNIRHRGGTQSNRQVGIFRICDSRILKPSPEEIISRFLFTISHPLSSISVALERSHAYLSIHLLFSEIRLRGRTQSDREVGFSLKNIFLTKSGQLLVYHHARYRNVPAAIFAALPLERSHAGNLIHLLFSEIRDRGRRQSGREVGIQRDIIK